MQQNLISQAEFSRTAGVGRSTIARVAKTVIKAAMVGKQINTNHPDAVRYLEKRADAQRGELAPGIDSMYEMAVKRCQADGRYSRNHIRITCDISPARASSIHTMMTAAGLIPTKGDSRPKPKHDKKNNPGRESAETRARATVAERLLPAAAQPATVVEPEPAINEIPDDLAAFADMTLRQILTRFGTEAAFASWLKAVKALEDIQEKQLKNAEKKGTLIHRDIVRLGIIEPLDTAHIKLLSDGAKTIARRATAMHDGQRTLEDIEAYVSKTMGGFIKPVKTKVGRLMKDV